MLSKKFVFPFYHLYYFPQYFPQYKFPQFAISEEKQILKEPKLRIGRCLEKSGPEGPTSVRANEARWMFDTGKRKLNEDNHKTIISGKIYPFKALRKNGMAI